MTKMVALAGSLFALAIQIQAAELHVATSGKDSNPGTRMAPLHTIQRAAELARPGDTVTVHEGTYRERVSPARGGDSDKRRIVYRAAPGEKVQVKGSEVVKDWLRVAGDTWKVTLANSFFGNFNPYNDLIHGDWFDRRGRDHHTGAVYLNGDWLNEAPDLDSVLKPVEGIPLWFGRVDDKDTTIWAQFKGVNPNEQELEINVRRTVFYPDKPGINYITVRGFILRDAATQWAPPTAEQVGLIGTHWSKGWIIEDNVISHSRCSGVTLGKYGDKWDNTSENTAEGYVKTIERALENGWNEDTIGHHIVRNNTITDCEQTGICGSLGAIFSRIESNHIYNIWTRRLFSGAEIAGIKIHAAIDVLIKHNRIDHAFRGMWMDWMAQGTRIMGNLCYDNSAEDLFVEVDHGPFLVDNNLFLSSTSLSDMSEGGAYAHNLMAGRIVSRPEPGRATPFHPAHSTAIAGLTTVKGGDDRFYNDIFVGAGETPGPSKPAGNDRQAAGYGLWVYDKREYPLQTRGNIYYYGAHPYAKEAGPRVVQGHDPRVTIQEKGNSVFVDVNFGAELMQSGTRLITTALLGKALISRLAYENADGSPLVIDTDYFGKHRSRSRPTPGPFENPGRGGLNLQVW